MHNLISWYRVPFIHWDKMYICNDLSDHNGFYRNLTQAELFWQKKPQLTTTHHCKLHLGKHQHLLPVQTVCHHRSHYIIMSRWDGLIFITDIQGARNCFIHELMSSKCRKCIVLVYTGNYSFETLTHLMWRIPVASKIDQQ